MDVELIPVEYEYKGEVKRFELVTVPDKQIATVTRRITGEDGRLTTEVVREGMTYEEICEYFPPRAIGKEYNMVGLFRSILYEAFTKEGKNLHDGEESNVRGFWYTHIMRVAEDVLGLGETNSVKTSLNLAWADMILSGMINYETMNIVSASEIFRISHTKDSPFSNLIVAVEKKDLFKQVSWIPQLFFCTLYTAGGQPSQNVADIFIRELKENGVDLNQHFNMCVISDLDAAGYYIQENFKAQCEKAIRRYGGSGTIEIRRLFVRKDQVTPELLEHDAVPAYDAKAKTNKAKKAEDTKWKNFCEITDGGLYKNVSLNVARSLGITIPEDHIGDTIKVRAKLELNAFGKSHISRAIAEDLLQIIAESSDESLIMIPEIMRIFNQQRRIVVVKDIYDDKWEEHIKPAIDTFLELADRKRSELYQTTDKERDEIWDEFSDHSKEVDDEFDPQVEGLREEADARVPDELAEEKAVEDEIAELEKKLQTIRHDIVQKTQDILDEIERVEGEKKEAIRPLEEERDNKFADIDKRWDYRKEQIEKFKREKKIVFNPVEKELEHTIAELLDDKMMPFWYRDLEADDRVRPHIAKLTVKPSELLDKLISAWEQEPPVFLEQDLLQKASVVGDTNIERHRKGFTDDFLDAINSMVLERAEKIEIPLPEIPEMEGFESEIEELMEQIQKDIENEVYKEKSEKEEE